LELKDIEILIAVIAGLSLVVFTPEPEFYYKSKKEDEKEQSHEHEACCYNRW
jgi:hypothetical protein